jgi:acyl carrier protein
VTSFDDLVASVLDLPAGDVHDDIGPATHEAWTSLRHLQLITAVESTYGFEFSRDEIRAVRSVGDLREALRSRGSVR